MSAREREEASRVLRENGLTIERDSPWRGREVELADLLREAAETDEPVPFTVHHLDGTTTIYKGSGC